MKIKNLFDDLKKIGRKKYYCKNGEEEIYFTAKERTIEIFNINGNIDLTVDFNGYRKNYKNSETISKKNKYQIQSILNSDSSLDIKSKKIAYILLEEFN